MITENVVFVFYAVVDVTIVFCVVSHIFVATICKRKGVRLVFCIFSGLIVCLSAICTLALKGVFALDNPIIDAVNKIDEAFYLIVLLAIAASCEFTGSLYSLIEKPKKQEEIELPNVNNLVLPDNTRKKNERKHAEYKILKGE